MRTLAWLTVTLLLLTVPSSAAPSQEEQAREHFAAGQREYQAGRYTEALHQFELGYALSPRPEFLINFAQVYRKLGDYDRAIAECERYLATAPPSSLAAEAERLLARVREERAAHPPAPAPEPAPPKPAPAPPKPVEVKPPAGDKPPPDVNGNANANGNVNVNANVNANANDQKPHRRRWVWAVVGTTIGLAVAAGVTLAVVFAPVRDTYPTAPGGAIDFR